MTRSKFLAFVVGLWVLSAACPAIAVPHGRGSGYLSGSLWHRRREVLGILASVEDLLRDVLTQKDGSREELGISTQESTASLERFLREVKACSALLQTSWPEDENGRPIEKPCEGIRFADVGDRVDVRRQGARAEGVAGLSGQGHQRKQEGLAPKAAGPTVRKAPGGKNRASALPNK